MTTLQDRSQPLQGWSMRFFLLGRRSSRFFASQRKEILDRLKAFSMLAITVVFLISLEPLTTFAQESGCATLLKPDVTEISSDLRMRLAYLNSITREQYNQAKEHGSLSALVPSEGVPVQLGGNYDQFRSSLEHYMQTVQFDLTVSQSQRYYASRIDPELAKAFVACIQTQGLLLTATTDPGISGEVGFRLEWKNPAGLQGPLGLSFDLGNNAVSNNPLPVSISAPGVLDFQINRNQTDRPLIVTVNGTTEGTNGNYAAQFYDPPVPVLHPPPANTAILRQEMLNGNNCSIRLTAPPGADCTPRAGGLARDFTYAFRYDNGQHEFTTTGAVCQEARSTTWVTHAGEPGNGTLSIGYAEAFFSFDDAGKLTGMGPYVQGWSGIVYCAP